MAQHKNDCMLVIYFKLALFFGVTLTLGCANSSPTVFSPAKLFGKVSGKVDASTSAADLKVNESYSTSTQWFESYENAHRESLRTGKPMLVAFTGSDWCGPCIQLKKNVFDSTAFQTWASKKAVLLELDFPKKSHQEPKLQTQNQRLAEKYDITGYPTVLFLDSGGEVLGKLGHGTDARKWIALAEKKMR